MSTPSRLPRVYSLGRRPDVLRAEEQQATPPASAQRSAPSRRWLRLGVAGCALVLLVVGGVLFDPSPGSPALPNPPCRQVLVLGFRGNGDSLDQDQGMGGDVWAVRQRLDSRIARLVDAGWAAFPYATGPVWLVPQHVITASRTLSTYLSGRHRACPAEQWVLIGQSEGAAVVHLALPSVTNAFTTAVLLADPARVAGTPYDTLTSRWDGVLPLLLLSRRWSLSGPRVNDNLPTRMTNRVRSYCLADDPVCNFSPGAVPHVLHGSAHTSYRLNPGGVADAAADFAAARVLADRR